MKNKIKFIIPSIITLILLLILFYIQGLYPFTNNSVVQVDADYQFIPVLYRIYDFLHGNGNILYDDMGRTSSIKINNILYKLCGQQNSCPHFLYNFEPFGEISVIIGVITNQSREVRE